ncbi:1858_t:CDS:2 [Ambispora gerdemannii]|uniref:DNA polymerase n=1 Tax=Ambispora gerdemannii TaxID=144530 RepID=A0A9N8W1M9_9GLOM|nr:1858_t:CDS:2 [Ambispora gerdemannii]
MIRQPQQLVLCFKQQQQLQSSTLRQSSTLNFKSSLPSVNGTCFKQRNQHKNFVSLNTPIESPTYNYPITALALPCKSTRNSRGKSPFGIYVPSQHFTAQRVKSPGSMATKKKTKEKIDVTKSEVSPVNLNEEITKVLEVLARNEKSEDNVYKERAYYNAIRTISLYPQKITSGEEAKQLRGIGESISRKIDEILSTGTCEKLTESSSNPTTQLMNLFTRIYGIGPVAARKFIEKGYQSIDDLSKDPDLTPIQRLGIKYLNDFEIPIPREEMIELDKLVTITAREIDERYTVTVCGSYRRGAPESSDIDIVLSHPDYISSLESDPGELLKKYVDCLSEKEFIIDHISSGAVKYMGICRLQDNESRIHRRIDIRLLPYDRYWLGIFTLTGDDEFNKKMRSRAMDLNMHLSEYILARKDKSTGEIREPIEVQNEADIFRSLGLSYIEPKDRSWRMVRKKYKSDQKTEKNVNAAQQPESSSDKIGKVNENQRGGSQQPEASSDKPGKVNEKQREGSQQPEASSDKIGKVNENQREGSQKPESSSDKIGKVNENKREGSQPVNSYHRDWIKEEIKSQSSSNRLLEATKRIFKWPWTGISSR